ncbi:XRE family transcriptional regulator [Biomaibacter acetigenes]|jgi:DNA-binding XRE family transcriptional regulator|uniref:XRE family transcriptional regulator n=1 Tax=Biomaibacter acetigenes TaxID=2316383 RepID=A0A3G2R5Y2_9FIRM|nr:XRE family transcriptional regulator [Biomaibacter acetigenes]
MNLKKVHEKLKKIRTDKNITQKEMALKLGYKDKSGYCQLENGDVEMTLEKAIKISQILGVRVEEIFFDTKVQASRTNQQTA